MSNQHLEQLCLPKYCHHIIQSSGQEGYWARHCMITQIHVILKHRIRIHYHSPSITMMFCQYNDSTLLKQQKGVGRRSELSRDYSTYTTCDTPPTIHAVGMKWTECGVKSEKIKEKEPWNILKNLLLSELHKRRCTNLIPSRDQTMHRWCHQIMIRWH